jgi:hypothetical protein
MQFCDCLAEAYDGDLRVWIGQFPAPIEATAASVSV